MLVRRVLVGLIVALTGAGCGGGASQDAPQTAPVKGKVTRKGTPLPGVSVTYQLLDAPEGQAAMSTAVTNAAGEYELIFSRNLKGAVPGKHRVRLTAEDGIDNEDPRKKAPDEVVIPPKIGTLEVTVPAAGLNGGEANFDLDF